LAQRRQQQRVLVVFAVSADQAGSVGDGEDAIDPNIPLVDQDFDLLGAEVGGGCKHSGYSGGANIEGA
jgi:hypothetical protein